MSMRDNEVLIICILIIFTTIVFGGHLGLAISQSGDINTPGLSHDTPNPVNFFGWLWQGIAFYFAITSFSVPGMPYEVGLIYIIVTLLPAFILLKFVRGTNS